eukprot:m.240416 g.240416  ORF g.240416 m.240416 type:complete len:328 (+) comp15044_c0_seq1:110-1093(+)
MQHDEVVWNIINQSFCSFKAKLDTENFCKHKDNVSGLCNRQSCPLSNSNYATIREEKGRVYLCMKTIERAHTPNKRWERLKLKQNYEQAIAQIEEQLKYWPVYIRKKCLQRFTKIVQFIRRSRKLALKPQREMMVVSRKVKKREETRERKALRAAHITETIEKALLDRLRKGTYEGIYNFPENVFDKAMENADVEEAEGEKMETADDAEEFVAEYEEEGDDDEDEWGEMHDEEIDGALEEMFAQYDDVEDGEEGEEGDDEDEEDEDDEDEEDDNEDGEERPKKKPKKTSKSDAIKKTAQLLVRRKKKAKVVVEYEDDSQPQMQTADE